MTQSEFRSTIKAALDAHAWFTDRGIRTFYLDGSTDSVEALEGDLRNADRAAVLLVTHIISGAVISTSSRGHRVKRQLDCGVLVRVNQTVAGAPSPDAVCDEVVKAVSGANTAPSVPGAEPILYKSQALIRDSVTAYQLIFTAPIIT